MKEKFEELFNALLCAEFVLLCVALLWRIFG